MSVNNIFQNLPPNQQYYSSENINYENASEEFCLDNSNKTQKRVTTHQKIEEMEKTLNLNIRNHEVINASSKERFSAIYPPCDILDDKGLRLIIDSPFVEANVLNVFHTKCYKQTIISTCPDVDHMLNVCATEEEKRAASKKFQDGIVYQDPIETKHEIKHEIKFFLSDANGIQRTVRTVIVSDQYDFEKTEINIFYRVFNIFIPRKDQNSSNLVPSIAPIKIEKEPSPTLKTKIIVKHDVGMGNCLTIRGNAPLNWEKGTNMSNKGSDRWECEIETPNSGNFEFKILRNDKDYEVGPNQKVESGKEITIEPRFS